jgi:hypothetical protein
VRVDLSERRVPCPPSGGGDLGRQKPVVILECARNPTAAAAATVKEELFDLFNRLGERKLYPSCSKATATGRPST